MPLFFSFLYLLMNMVASLPKDHKFYVSTTTMDFKEASASIQITSQFFIDDIEMLLREFHEEIQLAPDSDKTKVDVLFEGVLKQYFRIQIDNQDQDFNYLGREYKNEILQCYFELNVPESAQILRVQNSMLFSLFEEQQNILHFKSKEGRKSALLYKGKEHEVFSLY